jgi:hypothetical protein
MCLPQPRKKPGKPPLPLTLTAETIDYFYSTAITLHLNPKQGMIIAGYPLFAATSFGKNFNVFMDSFPWVQGAIKITVK